MVSFQAMGVEMLRDIGTAQQRQKTDQNFIKITENPKRNEMFPNSLHQFDAVLYNHFPIERYKL